MVWLKGMKGGADEGVIKIGFGTTTLRLDPGPKHDQRCHLPFIKWKLY